MAKMIISPIRKKSRALEYLPHGDIRRGHLDDVHIDTPQVE
jgi:hypothetical protein